MTFSIQTNLKLLSAMDVFTRCGKSPPRRQAQCPAKEAVLSAIDVGREATTSPDAGVSLGSGGVRPVYSVADYSVFLDTVNAEVAAINLKAAPWTENIALNKRTLQFKVDTGADVLVISSADYCKACDGHLRTPERILTGSAQQPLHIYGRFKGRLRRRDTELQQDVYVVSGLHRPLLGRPAIEVLGIVTMVEPVQAGNITASFPRLFQGLGKLKVNYMIKLRPDTKPFALTTPRRIALPLLSKVKAEVQRMEHLGVISKVKEPTV